jgi:hypothetical protein
MVSDKLTPAQVAALFLLALPLSLHSMYNSQANLFMVGAVLLSLDALLHRAWNWAAGWLAGAVLIKGYPLALALLVSIRFPRAFAWRFAVALGIGLGLPFITQPPSRVASQYVSWLRHLQLSTSVMRERLRSLDYLLSVCNWRVLPDQFLLMEIAAGLGVLGVLLFFGRTRSDLAAGATMMFELFAVWTVLFGPATESCTYVVMAPVVAWASVDVFSRPSGRWLRSLVVVSLVLMGPLTTDLFGPTIRAWANEYGAQPIGGLVFLIYIASQLWPLQVRPIRPGVSVVHFRDVAA